MQDVPQIQDVLLGERLVEPELVFDALDALRVRTAAGEGLGRIAGNQVNQEERNCRHAPKL